jgi:hypothetical protein
LALRNNFRVTKKFLITKFDCSIALRCKDNIIFGRSTTYIAEPVEPGEPGDK